MNYLEQTIQYYEANVYKTEPIGTCTLRQMLEAIKSPKPETLELFKKIEEASRAGDKKLKDDLKKKLYYFTPCVTTDEKGRKYDNITSFNGIMILDFDNLTEEKALQLKEFMFYEYNFIIASFLSSSKKGVKCLVRIPIVDSVESFKMLFYGISCTMQYIIGFDGSSQNPCLPNYLTYDNDILYREDATEWTELGYKEDEFKMVRVEDIEALHDVTEHDREEVKRILSCMINKIEDSGHYQLRSTAILGYGFAGAGYFTVDEMTDVLYDLIDSNCYLSIKPKVYKKTCLDMITHAVNSPVYLERHEKA